MHDVRPAWRARTAGARRRGVSYVFFLGTALLVAVIGLSALAVMRVRLRAAAADTDRATARYYARSAIDAALQTIADDDQWRENFTNDAWASSRQIGNGSFTYKFVDETHGNLTSDPNGKVRVYGKGVSGDSVWLYSVQVQPPPAELYPDLITNGDFETGDVVPWANDGDCSVTATNDALLVHSGTWALEVTGRASAGAGPRQALAGTVEQGATYYADLWVKMKDIPDTVWVQLKLDTDGGLVQFEFARAQVGTSWTHLAGTVTPTWTGAVITTTLKVATLATSHDYVLDDVNVRFVPTEIGPLAGTWQREAE
jgi:hypothetical protein